MNVIISVALATVIRIALGMLWYSPSVFGSAWMKTIKISPKDIKPKDAQIAILGGVLSSIIISAMLTCFITRLGIHSVLSGFFLGLSILFGFVRSEEHTSE